MFRTDLTLVGIESPKKQLRETEYLGVTHKLRPLQIGDRFKLSFMGPLRSPAKS